MRVGATLAVALLFAPLASASAQGRDWIVVTASAGGDATPVQRAAQRAVESLHAAGHTVVAEATLAARLRHGASAPMTLLTPSDAQRLASTDAAALDLVAFGSDDQALGVVEPALHDVEGRLAATGRDDEASRHGANLCLYAVRAQLHARRPEAAATQATRCLFLFPDLVPDPRMHPPPVRAAIDAAKRASVAGAATLVVEAPDTEGTCAVRLNGRRIAPSVPARISVVPGTYDLQVECDLQPGRVHRAVTRPGLETRLAIDSRLDDALGATDGSRLAYQDAEAMSAQAGRHAVALGAAARVEEVLLVRPASTGALALERYRVRDARRLARATVALGASERVPPAVTALLAGRSIQVGESTHAGSTAGAAGDDPTVRSGQSLLGPLALGTVGVVGVAVATVALLGAGCVDSGPSGACLEERHANGWAVAGYGGAGLLAIGGAVLWLLLGANSDEDDARQVPPPIAFGPRGLEGRLP